MGLLLGAGTAFALSTSESTDRVIPTYQYLKPGRVTLYARGSDANCYANLFINGVQVLRRQQIPFTGTAGALDKSAHKVASVNTMGGRVELSFVASTGTPTVDYILEHEGVPMVGGVLGGVLGAFRR